MKADQITVEVGSVEEFENGSITIASSPVRIPTLVLDKKPRRPVKPVYKSIE